jgi:hypothetical protein
MMVLALRSPRTSWSGLTWSAAPNDAVCLLGADGRVKPGHDELAGPHNDDWGGTGHDDRGERSVGR